MKKVFGEKEKKEKNPNTIPYMLKVYESNLYTI